MFVTAHFVTYNCDIANVITFDLAESHFFHFTSDYNYDVTIKLLTSQISRCDIPAAVREHVTVTSWLHEEGTAIEIAAEREPRGKYTLLQSGDLVIFENSH